MQKVSFVLAEESTPRGDGVRLASQFTLIIGILTSLKFKTKIQILNQAFFFNFTQPQLGYRHRVRSHDDGTLAAVPWCLRKVLFGAAVPVFPGSPFLI